MFRSFIQAGFECSTHRNRFGKRLDVLAATQHDVFAIDDYKRLSEFGIKTVRLGARWHLIEQQAGKYNFESLSVLLDAAADADIEVLLDILHFGWPDHLDVFAPEFVRDFGRYTLALTRFVKRNGYRCRVFAPINEISFLSWAGGEVGAINPHAVNRGVELKRNLIRSAVLASEILLNELAGVRLISPEPLIEIVGRVDVPGDEAEARRGTQAQYEAWDMLSGRTAPELGGRPEYLDILGVNFYERNQWVNHGAHLKRTDPRYRPFHQMIREVSDRYRRPLFVAETGTEDEERSDWFNYVSEEVRTAIRLGVPIEGICLYPILNHPGWDDDRHCQNGLFDYPDCNGIRGVHVPLAQAILMQQQQGFVWSVVSTHEPGKQRPNLFVSPPLELRFSTSPTPDEPIRA